MKTVRKGCLAGAKGLDLPGGPSVNGDPIPKGTEVTG